jgi:hypothetical protein
MSLTEKLVRIARVSSPGAIRTWGYPTCRAIVAHLELITNGHPRRTFA